jgi:hypothetical protein
MTPLVILVIVFLTLLTIQQLAVAQKDASFKIEITFVEGQNRNVSDARMYIQEYPQYGTNPPDGSYIDLNDAFYNDAPYTGVWKDEIVIPSGTIEKGEEFHVCIENTKDGITLACYELENTEKKAPEKLTIDFNNFP